MVYRQIGYGEIWQIGEYEGEIGYAVLYHAYYRIARWVSVINVAARIVAPPSAAGGAHPVGLELATYGRMIYNTGVRTAGIREQL